MKTNYWLIPLITVVTAAVGSVFTDSGQLWYGTINLPSWTPPGTIIGLVWTFIFILTTISALLVWNKKLKPQTRHLVAQAFLSNAFLNVFWSLLFFQKHLIGWAFIEALFLEISVIVLLVLLKPISRLATWLLLPYSLWVLFASFLTFTVWRLN